MLKMLGLDEIKTSNIITPSFSHTFDFNAVGPKDTIVYTGRTNRQTFAALSSRVEVLK